MYGNVPYIVRMKREHTERIEVRVRPALRRAVAREAKRQGIPESQFIRSTLTRECARLDEARQVPASEGVR